MGKTEGLFGFSRRLWQLMFSVGVWEMTFGSLLRTHAKNIRPTRVQKADGQEINEIDQDKEKEAVDVVLIEYPDRLVRFGFPYLLQAFVCRGVRLEVLEEPEKQEPLAEMTADLLTIVTV
jgi:hypothetical protein